MALILSGSLGDLSFVEPGKFYVLPWSNGFNYNEISYSSGVATNLGAIEIFTALVNTKNVASLSCNYTASTTRVYGITNGVVSEIGKLTSSSQTLAINADYIVIVARASSTDVENQRYTITDAT